MRDMRECEQCGCDYDDADFSLADDPNRFCSAGCERLSRLPNTPMQRLMASIAACSAARRWVDDMTLEEAWARAERLDWMCYLLYSLEERFPWGASGMTGVDDIRELYEWLAPRHPQILWNRDQEDGYHHRARLIRAEWPIERLNVIVRAYAVRVGRNPETLLPVTAPADTPTTAETEEPTNVSN